MVLLLVYTTLYHPGYTTVCTYPVACTSVLHGWVLHEALGSNPGIITKKEPREPPRTLRVLLRKGELCALLLRLSRE